MFKEFKWFIVAWIVGALVSFTIVGVIIWAIIRLVLSVT